MVRFRYRGSGEATGKRAGPVGKLGISVFFFFFFAIGSLFEVFILREFGLAVGQRFWKKTSCEIVRSEIQERDDGENAFGLAVRYEYTYVGRTYEGSTYKRGYSGSENYSDAQTLVQRFPSGRKASCYVNAKNPAQAVLRRNSLLVGLAFFFPLIFVLIGAGGIYFTWRKAPPPEAKPIAAPIVRNGHKGKYALAGFFAIFGIAGLAMLYPHGIRPIAKTLDAKSWAPTPCKVLRGQVRSHSSDDGTTYSVYLLYEYEFNGRLYKADRYDFVGGSSSGRQRKARVVKEYKTAAAPVCYVNPENSSEAVLKRGFHAKLLFALFPLPFILVGVGGACYALRKKRPSGSETWMPEQQGTRSVSDGLSVLRQLDTGPLVLKPRHSPRVKFFGAIFIALFWNGIVSVFVVQVVGGFRQGHPSWGMTLFMVPFVVVGVGLLGLIVYQFLAPFNPRPTLELSSA